MGYDIRDFRYGPKCAAYLWGDDLQLMTEMGRRIFLDQHDQDGKLLSATMSASARRKVSPSRAAGSWL